MFDFMLDAAANIKQIPHETVAEKLAVGGEVSLRGMATVFAVLILIWIIVEILHVILGGFSENKSQTQTMVEAAAPAKAADDNGIQPALATEPAATTAMPDYELIAVITAAIAAASGSSPSSFRVVSFKRANNKFSSGK